MCPGFNFKRQGIAPQTTSVLPANEFVDLFRLDLQSTKPSDPTNIAGLASGFRRSYARLYSRSVNRINLSGTFKSGANNIVSLKISSLTALLANPETSEVAFLDADALQTGSFEKASDFYNCADRISSRMQLSNSQLLPSSSSRLPPILLPKSNPNHEKCLGFYRLEDSGRYLTVWQIQESGQSNSLEFREHIVASRTTKCFGRETLGKSKIELLSQSASNCLITYNLVPSELEKIALVKDISRIGPKRSINSVLSPVRDASALALHPNGKWLLSLQGNNFSFNKLREASSFSITNALKDIVSPSREGFVDQILINEFGDKVCILRKDKKTCLYVYDLVNPDTSSPKLKFTSKLQLDVGRNCVVALSPSGCQFAVLDQKLNILLYDLIDRKIALRAFIEKSPDINITDSLPQDRQLTFANQGKMLIAVIPNQQSQNSHLIVVGE